MEILKSDLDYAVKMERLKYEYQNQKYESAKQTLGEEIRETNIVPPHELDSDQILNRLIENQILYQEAKARGLDVSYEKAEDYAKGVREIQQQIRSGEVSVLDMEELNQTKDIIKEYIDGMGVAEDEYWIMTVPIYQKALSIGNLKAEIISSVQNGDYHKDPYEHIKQCIQDIKKQYEIGIFSN